MNFEIDENNKLDDISLEYLYEISNEEDIGGEEILGNDDDWDNDDVSKLE